MKKIKVYTQAELDRIRPLLSEYEILQQNANGTIESYTIFEFVDMLCSHTWQGGMVEGIGFIPANMFQEVETGSSDYRRFTAVLDSSSSSSFDFDSFWSSFYSMMERNLFNDISNLLQSSSSPETNSNNSNNNTQNEEISAILGVNFTSNYILLHDDLERLRILLEYQVARTSHQLFFRFNTLKSNDYFIHDDLELRLRLEGYNINTAHRVLADIHKDFNLRDHDVSSSTSFYVNREDDVDLYLIALTSRYHAEFHIII